VATDQGQCAPGQDCKSSVTLRMKYRHLR